jgi:hypothetical protein
MDVGKVSGIVVIMLLPTLIVGALVYLPRVLRAIQAAAERRARPKALVPAHAPIEELAADLRRLLHQHETLRTSTGLVMRAHRLFALEAAIADGATEAAAALGLSYSDRSPGQALSKPDLRRLLNALGDAGLMLPPTSILLGADGHS